MDTDSDVMTDDDDPDDNDIMMKMIYGGLHTCDDSWVCFHLCTLTIQSITKLKKSPGERTPETQQNPETQTKSPKREKQRNATNPRNAKNNETHKCSGCWSTVWLTHF